MRYASGGKVYDTATAQLVHTWDSGHNAGDFHESRETLFRTRNGTYFVHGRGGALSRWGVPVGNNGRGGGSAILPLTDEEAREWLEQHDAPVEVIEALFTLEEA